MNIFGRLWNWIASAVSENSPLDKPTAQTFKELNALADAASFAMARADDKFDELTATLARHQALDEQATECLRAGDGEAARHCVAQRLQAEQTLQHLLNEYETLQQEAEQKVRQFVERRQALERKVKEIPLPRSQEAEIDSAMYMLRQKVTQQPITLSTIEGFEEDPVILAKKLLGAPRYKGLLPDGAKGGAD